MNRRVMLLFLGAFAIAGTSCDLRSKTYPAERVFYKVDHPDYDTGIDGMTQTVIAGERSLPNQMNVSLKGGKTYQVQPDLDDRTPGHLWATVRTSTDGVSWEQQNSDLLAPSHPTTLTFKDGVKVHLTYAKTTVRVRRPWTFFLP